MLHDHKDSRTAFDAFATRLQKPNQEEGDTHPSFAVLTVDLRGHGDSLKQAFPNGIQEFDTAKLRPEDFAAMVRFDMEEVRKFLVTKNDEGKLNLNKLSLIGVGTGASVALLWASADWSAPPLAVGKQGQDVKALVLVSPRWKNRGLPIHEALKHRGLQRQVAMMIMYGAEDAKVTADARRIYKQLERYHPEPESSAAETSRTLVALGFPNKLQGNELLTQVGKPAQDRIIEFIATHADSKDYQWLERRSRF
jgi:pimeloyl-ACP methyl ester carboxylesterase